MVRLERGSSIEEEEGGGDGGGFLATDSQNGWEENF